MGDKTDQLERHSLNVSSVICCVTLGKLLSFSMFSSFLYNNVELISSPASVSESFEITYVN